MRRGTWVSAAGRANYLLETYPQSAFQYDAIAVLADSYTHLGNKTLADDAPRPAVEPAGPPVAGRQVAEVPMDDPQAEPVRWREVRQHRPAQRATGRNKKKAPQGLSLSVIHAMRGWFVRPWTTTLGILRIPGGCDAGPNRRASPSTLRRNGHPGREGALMTPPPRHFRPRACSSPLPCWRCPRPPWLPHRQHRAICCLQPLSRVVGALQGRARLQAVLPYRIIAANWPKAGLLYLPAGTAPAGGWSCPGRMARRASPIAVRLRSPARTSPRDGRFLDQFLAQGYAVVAADYQGLGSQAAMPICMCALPRNAIDMIKASRQYRQRDAVAALGLGRPFAGRCRRAHGGPHRPLLWWAVVAVPRQLHHRNAHRSRTDRAGDEARQPHRQSGRAQRVSRVSARWPAAGRAADRPRPQR